MSKLTLGLLAALATAPVFAQATSAGVGGLVTRTDGQPVVGAEVTITHVESGTVSRATTDASGRYAARGLRVGGPYTVTINKPGEGTKTEDNVFLDLNKVNTINAALTGDLTTLETVTAVAAGGSDVFSATKMGAGTSISRQVIEALPSVNGNIQDYMRLDPRLTVTDRASGSISAGGQNPRFNKITIDGVSASDTFGLEGNNMPTQRQPVSMDAIEAIDVNVANYDVSFSGAAGANVNAVTKSGTNEFHGSIYGSYRDGDWFGDYPARVAGSTLDVTGLPFDEFTDETTYGMTFGGPVIKDKLFFFANYEKFKQTDIGPAGKSQGTNPLATVGSDFNAADVAAVQDIARDVWGFDPGSTTGTGDTELEEYAVKFDWNINDAHRANFRYSKLEQNRVRPEASTASVLALSSNWYNHVKTVESYVGQLFSDWTDTFSTEFKVSYRDYSAIRVSPTTAPSISVFFDDGNASTAINTGDAIRLGTERSSPGNTLLTETWNYFLAGTWSLGDHDIKAGGEYSENEIYNFFLQDSWGNYSFYVPKVGGVSDYGNLIRKQYFDYDLQTNPTDPDAIAARYKDKRLGLFVQDTWYATQNLTLNFGIRADRAEATPTPPFNACFASPRVGNNTGPTSCPNGGFGLDNTTTYTDDFLIQPRFGFNYSFDWERPAQLRGGIGLFQGDAPNVWVGNAYSSTGMNYIAYGTPGTWSATNTQVINCTGPATNPTTGFNPATGLCNNGVQFSGDGFNQPIPATGAGVRNVNLISEDFELPSVWKANVALDVETPWNGIVASAELLLTDVKNGLFYRSLNVGPGFLGPDGRVLYWNPNSVNRNATARFGNNSYFGDVYALENTGKGKGQQFTVSLTQPFVEGSDWSWSLAYTYTNAEEVSALTSSTAGSGYGSQLGFNINEPTSSTARYEIRDRITGALNWDHKFFGDYATHVGLFYEGRSGRPYSYIFSGDSNGDGRTFNDLFYVPAGPGDVLFGTLNATTGAFTANAQMEQDFWKWMGTQTDLQAYRGQVAPENGFRAGWVNTFDVRISQELPGFFEGHKSQIWFDIQNIGNLLNKDWGHVIDYGFNANNAVAQVVGIDRATGKYVYTYRSGTEFGQATALGLPTNADGQTNGISQWSLSVGLRYEF
ncbi:TonB-dependent receptor [Lysobacter sp. LF1]|uniref:TonB-dependent receptor n=1 Tax=Lysobacter stagni TaxID=3045172 RepID=A0ABT6XKV0_9GAMM|nr:TonB-dependent receptor [Lysobacter sp. LF1]MDI9240793.1 TonB-dependent receptor [Lysobacter sp. LF1]